MSCLTCCIGCNDKRPDTPTLRRADSKISLPETGIASTADRRTYVNVYRGADSRAVTSNLLFVQEIRRTGWNPVDCESVKSSDVLVMDVVRDILRPPSQDDGGNWSSHSESSQSSDMVVMGIARAILYPPSQDDEEEEAGNSRSESSQSSDVVVMGIARDTPRSTPERGDEEKLEVRVTEAGGRMRSRSPRTLPGLSRNPANPETTKPTEGTPYSGGGGGGGGAPPPPPPPG
ncbi:MAG: hypothetical protein OXF02_04305 [Simkaniaceae bacterium]|nr:hypothetical protein [Simkaniaceae bacterium]